MYTSLFRIVTCSCSLCQTNDLTALLLPSTPLPVPVSIGIQYLLSKAILKQAEEEVTAKPSTAFPLARVVAALIERCPSLGRVFMAKLVSKTGPWVVATPISREPVSRCLRFPSSTSHPHARRTKPTSSSEKLKVYDHPPRQKHPHS